MSCRQTTIWSGQAAGTEVFLSPPAAGCHTADGGILLLAVEALEEGATPPLLDDILRQESLRDKSISF